MQICLGISHIIPSESALFHAHLHDKNDHHTRLYAHLGFFQNPFQLTLSLKYGALNSRFYFQCEILGILFEDIGE